MEYLVCRQEINDTRYSIYERCATFERNLALTDNRLVKLDIVQQVFKELSKRIILVLSVYKHIKETSNDSIIFKSATFHFKIDNNGKIWLLFISSINTSQNQQIGMKPANSILKISFSENIEAKFNQTKKDLIQSFMCFNCYQHFSKGQMVRIKMNQFIGFFEAKKKYMRGGIGKKLVDEYEIKEQMFDPLTMVKESYPLTFMIDGKIDNAKQELQKKIEAVLNPY